MAQRLQPAGPEPTPWLRVAVPPLLLGSVPPMTGAGRLSGSAVASRKTGFLRLASFQNLLKQSIRASVWTFLPFFLSHSPPAPLPPSHLSLPSVSFLLCGRVHALRRKPKVTVHLLSSVSPQFILGRDLRTWGELSWGSTSLRRNKLTYLLRIRT